MQEYQAAERRPEAANRGGGPHRRELRKVRITYGNEDRTIRQIHCMLQVSRMQDHQTALDRSQMPSGRRRHSREEIEARQTLLELRQLSELHICLVVQAGARRVPQMQGPFYGREKEQGRRGLSCLLRKDLRTQGRSEAAGISIVRYGMDGTVFQPDQLIHLSQLHL